MLYLLQTIAYAAVCYLLYMLFLKDRPMHRFSRLYLLVCATLPFVLPFVKLNFLSAQESPVTEYINVRMPEIAITDAALREDTYRLFLLLAMLYATISLTFLAITVYKWLRLKSIIRKSEKQAMPGYTLLTHTGFGPGSWGRYIFLPEGHADPRIIAHEAAHIRLHHTKDMVFLTAMQCVFWYHPVLHLIKKELRQVHEFEADAAVKTDTAEYQELLLHHFLTECRLPFAHSFIHHPIKRRIMMLNKNNRRSKNYVWSMAFTTVAFLLFAGNMIWFQSGKAKSWEMKKEEAAPQVKQGNRMDAAGKDSAWIYTVAYKMPQPSVDLAVFLGENIHYPEAAKKRKLEGRVLVKFIVDKEGKITDAHVVKSPDELLSQEALRVIRLIPDWTPGENEHGEKVAVYFTQPIFFRLGDEGN